MDKHERLVTHLLDEISQEKDPDEWVKQMNAVAFALGGLVVSFHPDERGPVFSEMIQSMGRGLMDTSQSVGEKGTFMMVVKK